MKIRTSFSKTEDHHLESVDFPSMTQQGVDTDIRTTIELHAQGIPADIRNAMWDEEQDIQYFINSDEPIHDPRRQLHIDLTDIDKARQNANLLIQRTEDDQKKVKDYNEKIKKQEEKENAKNPESKPEAIEKKSNVEPNDDKL